MLFKFVLYCKCECKDMFNWLNIIVFSKLKKSSDSSCFCILDDIFKIGFEKEGCFNFVVKIVVKLKVRYFCLRKWVSGVLLL